MRQRGLVWLGILVLVLASCGPAATPTSVATPTQPSSTVSPTAVPTAVPGATSPAPTPTPRPTPAPTAASAAKPKYGGTIVSYIRDDPAPYTWDPMVEKSGNNPLRVVEHQVFNLVNTRYPPDAKPCDNQVSPELAESWSWPNDTTLVIKLRQGVRFHDKPPVNRRELTADDVAFTMDRAMYKEPIRGGPAAGAVVTKMEAVDRYTLRITTSKPLPYIDGSFLSSYTGISILAKESVGPKGTWDDPEKTWVGTGPFIFEQWTPGVKTVVRRNPNYFKQGLPYVDRWEWRVVPDQSTRLAMLRAGKMDVYYAELPGLLAKGLEKTNPELKFGKCLSNTLQLTFQQDKPPFNDVRLRRAAAMAVDRQALVNGVLQSDGEVSAAYTLLHPWYRRASEFEPELRQYLEYRPDRAKQLLAEAGYPGGGPEVTLSTNQRFGSPYRELTEAMGGMLQAVGFKVRYNWQEFGLWSSTSVQGKFEGAIAQKMDGEDQPFGMLPQYHSKSEVRDNKGHANDPVLDGLIDQFVVATDPARQKELAHKIEDRQAEMVHFIKFPGFYDYNIVQPWVRGFLMAGPQQVSTEWSERVWIDK